MSFYYKQDFDTLNFSETPHLYRIGKGEQGVLSVEPYKSEILPHWRFQTPEIAQESADAIYQMFLDYLNDDDFVSADMARKFLQMAIRAHDAMPTINLDGNIAPKIKGMPLK